MEKKQGIAPEVVDRDVTEGFELTAESKQQIEQLETLETLETLEMLKTAEQAETVEPTQQAETKEVQEVQEAKEVQEVQETVKETTQKTKKKTDSTPKAQSEEELVIDMKGVIKKFYIDTPNELTILKGIDLDVKEGEFISIVGVSGSGKSTLMNIIGALDYPTQGRYHLSGENIYDMSSDVLSEIRNEKIGFVFQTFNLIPRMDALKNVELPLLYAGVPRGERRQRAEELLDLVGMGDRMDHQPNELSGGQKQRVAIARAMANNPDIILADEPTGALDTETGLMVMDVFHLLHKEQGKTIVLITHNEALAQETERILTISDGMIVDDRPNTPIIERGEL